MLHSSSTFQDCEHTRKNHKGYEGLHDHSPLAIKAIVRLTLHGACVSNNKDALDILSTLAIAVFTFTLWRSTEKLWAAGEKQTNLLADQFAAAHNPLVFIQFRRTKGFVYDWINIGGGAAILTEAAWDFRLADVGDLPAPIDPANFETTKIPMGIVVHAGKGGESAQQPDHADIESRWVASVPKEQGGKSIFYIGFVRYQDMFGSRFITGFCAVHDATSDSFRLIGDERYNYHNTERPDGPDERH